MAAITLNVLEPRYIRLNDPAKLTFDLIIPLNDRSDASNLLFGKVFGFDANLNARFFQDIERIVSPDPENVGKGEFNPLVGRNVHTCNTRHSKPP
jgi:hypothetical protein